MLGSVLNHLSDGCPVHLVAGGDISTSGVFRPGWSQTTQQRALSIHEEQTSTGS
jgi:hypothetical protein